VSPRSALAGLAAVYAALATLVATGALNGIDQWSIDNLMPGAGGGGDAPSTLEAAVPLLHSNWSSWLHVVTNVVTVPAQGIVSLLILLAIGRQGRLLGWLLAWLGANAVEYVCKSVIVRPPLFGPEGHIAGFDSSFPSGHTLRAAILAVALATLWPRAKWLLAAWAGATFVLLEVAGHHVPSDIVGGAVLATFVLGVLGLLPRGGAARALGARGLGAPTRGAG
jgi:membrane-associated phospholipid phosphatase